MGAARIGLAAADALILCVLCLETSMKKRKELLKAPPQRHRISTVSGYDLQKANRIKQFKKRPARPSSGDASASSDKEGEQPRAKSADGDAQKQTKKKRKQHKKAKVSTKE